MTPPLTRYRRYPIAAWLSWVALVLGAVIAVAPALADTSPTLAVMPAWGTTLWGVVWFVGGAFALMGLARPSPKLEAGGFTLQSAAWLAAFVAGFYNPTGPSVLGAIFAAGAAIGTYLHGRMVERS